MKRKTIILVVLILVILLVFIEQIRVSNNFNSQAVHTVPVHRVR